MDAQEHSFTRTIDEEAELEERADREREREREEGHPEQDEEEEEREVMTPGSEYGEGGTPATLKLAVLPGRKQLQQLAAGGSWGGGRYGAINGAAGVISSGCFIPGHKVGPEA